MNELAFMWAKRESDRIAHKELVIIAKELRETQVDLRILRERAADRRQDNMKQEGSRGFIMVP